MNRRQNRRTTNRFIYRTAGRIARQEGKPFDAVPELRRNERDTYGAWLMEEWRDGWKEQDEEIRQGSLFKGEK